MARSTAPSDVRGLSQQTNKHAPRPNSNKINTPPPKQQKKQARPRPNRKKKVHPPPKQQKPKKKRKKEKKKNDHPPKHQKKTRSEGAGACFFFAVWAGACFFPTLAVGLLDFKVDVVLARLEADSSDQPPGIPAVPNHQVSLQCPTNEYPCTGQPQSILTLPNRKVIPAVSNCKVSLQCPTSEYPGSLLDSTCKA